MPLTTRDGAAILRVNGIQTQSERYIALCDELHSLKVMGVTHARLLPQNVDMVAVAKIFEGLVRGDRPLSQAHFQLSEICRNQQFSNGFFHGVAGYRLVEPNTAALS